jgi:general secretion pathway protein K
MTPRRREKQRGVALLMVLIALTILGSMTADLMETNEVYLATAVNARDAKQAEYMAKSGVNLARLTLTFREILGSTALPFWQYSDMIINTITSSDGGFLGDLTGADLTSAEGIGLKGVRDDSDLEVVIVDEESKLNINIANTHIRGNGAEKMLLQLGALVGSEDFDHLFSEELNLSGLSTREDIICEIIDWTDPDPDLCDGSGSEDGSLYSGLIPSYERKNAPFDSLEELHLVSGITDDFWAAFVDPYPEDPTKRIMTVWGKGRINVNTAPIEVLYPIVCDLASDDSGINACLDETTRLSILVMLQFIMTYRTLMPFQNYNAFLKALENPATMFLPDAPGIPMNRQKKRAMRKILTTQSSVFSIYAKGTVGRVSKRIHAVVDMKNEVQLALPDDQSLSLAGGKVLYYRIE